MATTYDEPYPGVLRVEENNPEFGHYRGELIGPFESYEALCEYRERTGTVGIETWVEPPKVLPKHYIDITIRKEIDPNDPTWALYSVQELADNEKIVSCSPISIPGPWRIIENKRVTE